MPALFDYKARRCYQQYHQRNSFTDKLFLIINTVQFTHCHGINLAIMYKLPSVHKKGKKKGKFNVIFECSKHPNVKLSVKYSNHKTLTFLNCNVTINQDNLSTSLFRKK